MILRINRTEQEVASGPGALLVYVLRDELGMTGTKIGCAAGICGSCTVMIDGVATRSWITTIEGLVAENANGTLTLHPVQQAFVDAQVPQCGWCMSGQIMTAVAFLQQNPAPTEDDVVEAMANNYCRCGCYYRIKQAVVAAADAMAVAPMSQEVSA